MVIHGRLAVVTGASSGIGEATAKAIARKGGRVVLVARSTARLEAVAQEITAGHARADVLAADLSEPDVVADLVARIRADIGVPDIVVNNAGAGRWSTIEETEALALEQMLALPFFAAFNLTRGFLPAMRERGSGHIAT